MHTGKFAAFVRHSGKKRRLRRNHVRGPASVKREQPFQHGCGIGIYGPAIDDYGNSMTGGMLLKHIAREWDLSIF